MHDETKKAVSKAFEISKTIFGLGAKNYAKLLKATSKIRHPSISDLKPYIEDGFCLEDALIMELKKRYTEIAVREGFSKKHGLAMLEYAAMMEELK